jgi:hypothetical protein
MRWSTTCSNVRGTDLSDERSAVRNEFEPPWKQDNKTFIVHLLVLSPLLPEGGSNTDVTVKSGAVIESADTSEPHTTGEDDFPPGARAQDEPTGR